MISFNNDKDYIRKRFIFNSLKISFNKLQEILEKEWSKRNVFRPGNYIDLLIFKELTNIISDYNYYFFNRNIFDRNLNLLTFNYEEYFKKTIISLCDVEYLKDSIDESEIIFIEKNCEIIEKIFSKRKSIISSLLDFNLNKYITRNEIEKTNLSIDYIKIIKSFFEIEFVEELIIIIDNNIFDGLFNPLVIDEINRFSKSNNIIQ